MQKEPTNSTVDTSISEDFTMLLFAMGRLIGKEIKADEGGNISSMMGMKTLYLVANKKLPSMKDIAECFHITPPSATAMVDKLVNEKYLKRSADKSDRRAIRVELTPLGMKKLKDSMAKMSERMNELTNILTPAEKTEFTRILKKIIEQHNK
jgi:DNA-binding MarR family transcriptional regulator